MLDTDLRKRMGLNDPVAGRKALPMCRETQNCLLRMCL